MSTSLGKAVIHLGADDGSLVSDLNKAKSKVATSLKNIGESVTKAGKKMTAAVTLPILALAAVAVNSASDLEESLNKVDVVFGSSADSVKKWAEGSAENLGLSKQKALEAAGTFGNLFTAMKIGTEDSKDMSLGLVQLAADLASFNNMDPTEVLNKLRAGMTGEAEPLKVLGVNLNQTVLALKAMEMGLVELTPDLGAVESATKSLDKSQNELKLALYNATPATQEQKEAIEEMRKAYYDVNAAVYEAGEGSSEHLQAISKLQDQYEEYKEVLGSDVAEAMGYVSAEADNLGSALLGKAGDLDAATKAQAAYAIIMEQTVVAQGDFGRTSEGLANATRIAKAQLENASAVLGDQLIPHVLKAVTMLSGLITKFEGLSKENKKTIVIIAAVAAAIGPLLLILGTLISSLGAIAGVIGGPILIAIGALAALVAFLAWAWKNDWMGMQTTLKKLWFDTLEPIFIEIKTWLQKNIPAAIEILKHFWETVLQPAIKIVWAFINDHLLPLFRALGDFLGTVFTLTLTILAGIWQNVLQPALEDIWEFISKKLQPIFETLADFWENTLKPAFEKIKFLDVLQKHFDRIGEAIQKVIRFIKDLTEKLKKINLPKWMTPGSPTPWEIGLLGVSDAMREVAMMQINLGAGLQGSPAPAIAAAATGGPGVGGSFVQETHFHIGTLVADERGLTELERRLRPIRDTENQRRGTD